MNFPWRKRNDLIIQPHDTGGWLIKDPVSLQYTLLSSLEYQVFQKLDGLTDLRTIFTTRSGQTLTPQDVESFISHLIKRQLLFRPSGGDAERFSGIQSRTTSTFAWLSRLLSWYVPLGNPRSTLARLQWMNRIVFHTRFVQLSFVLFVAALFVFSLNANRLIFDLKQLATSITASSAVLIFVILVAVKLAHELGHALSAQHFKADCHEAGILFLFLTPVPFTNVTDSWKLPVAQRMIVTAAGIIVELWIACLCIVLWSLAADGLTKSLLLQTALICSVNTVFFNGNPLLKFDGYFLLSDFLRIPNLAARSAERLRSLSASFLSGRPVVSVHDQEHAKTLISYAVLACAYRLLITFSILEAIHFVCSSYELNVLGWLLKILTTTMLIGIPVIKFMMALISEPPNDATAETGLPTSHVLTTFRGKGFLRTSILLAIISVICFVPIPSREISVATVTPVEQRIFAGVSGRLTMDSFPTGESIPPHSWRLTRVESDLTLHNLKAEGKLATLQRQIAQRTKRTEAGPSIQELQEACESAEVRLADFQRTLAKQSQPIRDPDANIIRVRTFRQDDKGAFDEDWSGQPLSAQNLGAWIQQGTTLAYLKSDQPELVTAWVSQSAIQRMKIGQSASFRLSAGDAIIKAATVKSIARFPTKNLPINVANLGHLPGTFTEVGFQPDDTFYAVTLQLLPNKSDNRLPLNGVGYASVEVAHRSFASRFYDYLRRTFLFTPTR